MSAATPFRCYVMGSESLLVQCSEILIAEGHSILGVISDDTEIVHFAEERGLRVVEPGRDLAARISHEPFEWLFSIANLEIIPKDVLALPTRGAINFHDGPLPRYAGLNAPCWAILHGERTHGVTWHRIEGGVDEGEILEQRIFELSERETALTLNTRCYELGIETFARLIDALGRGEEQGRPQDLTQRSYFGRYDRPPAACTIDWDAPAHRIDALVRALDHGRYPNPLGVPKIVLEKGVVLLPEVERAADAATLPPGSVIAFDETGLEVATATGSLLFPRVLDVWGRPLTPEQGPELGLERGKRLGLDPDARERLSAVDAELAQHEAFWSRRLTTLEPARLPEPPERAATHGGPRLERREILRSADPARLLAALGALLARVSSRAQLDLAFRHPGIAERVRGAEALYAPWVPLRLSVDRESSIASLEPVMHEEFERVIERGTYLVDLVHRQPSATPPAWEIGFELVTSLETAAPSTLPVTLVTDRDRAVLVFDAERISARSAEALHERLELLLHAIAEAGTTPVRAVPLLTPEARHRVLVEWNATATDYPRDASIHQLFEARADAAPNEVALIFHDVPLTYAELERRANRLAHHLIALGVGPETPVGLATERSFDLVVGALAILKAGGAYVPLDPSYPPERVSFMLDDSGAKVVVTSAKVRSRLPAEGKTLVSLDKDALRIEGHPASRPNVDVRGSNLAYLIYTSGSTGTPKGVMVEHRNVVNFFAGMDRVLRPEQGRKVWLAITSLSFDISVLELFYTLARGFTVVLAAEEDRLAVTSRQTSDRGQPRGVDLSLFYFASDEGERASEKYRLLLDGARFADEHGFSAVWTPERHFHAFGGLYPNPSVASAALAVITQRVKIRAGSCVNPLHHPIRVAEEWALVDNLSGGRVGISFAAGWQPNDFVLRPESFESRKERMVEEIDIIRRLWRGEKVEFEGPKGPVEIGTLPRPVQAELPFWITAAGSPDTFRLAGRLGGGVLTHLLGQSLEEVEQKIALYRQTWREAGHGGDGHVVLMLHSFVGPNAAKVKEIVRGPMKEYLRSSMQLIEQHAWSFPAFKRAARDDRSFKDNFLNLSPDDIEALLDHSFERYYETSGLFGTVERGIEIVERCRAVGVDEVACLIDFGVDSDTVMAHLPYLDAVREAVAAKTAEHGPGDQSIAAQLVRHGVTHLQCTPSMARMLLSSNETRSALGNLSHLLIGGEALPSSLARELTSATRARITNMYGPTETTVWSSYEDVEATELQGSTIPIGRPIANTSFYVLDDGREPVPVGVPGELYIGGDGVTRGYWGRPELTDERFVPDPFAKREGARMYRTGDEVRLLDDGRLQFLGRIDHQVKIRGHRIELGEIEARLTRHPSVREAAVIAREDHPGDPRLIAYVTPNGSTIDPLVLKTHLRAALPEFMVPSHIVQLERFPLTPNKKVDRKALPSPESVSINRAEQEQENPAVGIEATIAEIWKQILGVSSVSVRDNFFDLGGHSLLAVQAHREIKEALGKDLTVTDIFRFPTIAALAAHLQDGAHQPSGTLEASAGRAAARQRAVAFGNRRVLRRR